MLSKPKYYNCYPPNIQLVLQGIWYHQSSEYDYNGLHNLLYNELYISFIYMDRIKQSLDLYRRTTTLSIHEIFSTCLILANKWISDTPYAIDFWSEITFVDKYQLIQYEKFLLRILKYDLHVKHEEFIFWKRSCDIIQ